MFPKTITELLEFLTFVLETSADNWSVLSFMVIIFLNKIPTQLLTYVSFTVDFNYSKLKKKNPLQFSNFIQYWKAQFMRQLR